MIPKKKGRPNGKKLHPLDTSSTRQHIRNRGLELYHWKSSKLIEDLNEESRFVRSLVNKVRKGKIEGLSR